MLANPFIPAQVGIPTLLWSGPGVGKTSMINHAAQVLGVPCKNVILSISEPADIGGFPKLEKDRTVRLVPEWFKELQEAGKGILFLDEITTAPRANQAAALRLVCNGAIDDNHLPENVMIIGAANPPELAAGGNNLSAAMANRWLHINFEAKPAEWVEGFLSNWEYQDVPIVPSSWKNYEKSNRAVIASFIRTRQSFLYQCPEDSEEKQGGPWASPRTWEYAARVMAACEALGIDDLPYVRGLVGDGPAKELLAYRKELDLPDPEDIIKNPKKFKFPNRSDKAFAILNSVVSAIANDCTGKRWQIGWDVLKVAIDQGQPDVAMIPAKILKQNQPKGVAPPESINAFSDLFRKAKIQFKR